MNIKIKTWEALKMLKQVNPLLTNNEIPLEILNTVEELLENAYGTSQRPGLRSKTAEMRS